MNEDVSTIYAEQLTLDEQAAYESLVHANANSRRDGSWSTRDEIKRSSGQLGLASGMLFPEFLPNDKGLLNRLVVKGYAQRIEIDYYLPFFKLFPSGFEVVYRDIRYTYKKVLE